MAATKDGMKRLSGREGNGCLVGRLMEMQMAAYVVITREKTRNAAPLEQYKQLAPASFNQYPVTFRAYHGRHEVLEGAAIEDIIILEFPSYEEAEAWYHSPAYQAASEHRYQGADYRCILVDGVAAK
jgi:uncharacterized protein (DUF1330 family)